MWLERGWGSLGGDECVNDCWGFFQHAAAYVDAAIQLGSLHTLIETMVI